MRILINTLFSLSLSLPSLPVVFAVLCIYNIIGFLRILLIRIDFMWYVRYFAMKLLTKHTHTHSICVFMWKIDAINKFDFFSRSTDA